MKLKHITKLLFAIFLVFAIGACNDDSTTTVVGASADAQIYTFSLKGKAYNAIDSATYPTLNTTKFAIDQFRSLIYNPDSLPYLTELKSFAATLSYGNSTPSGVQLIYPNDSVVDWNSSDSIDFSTPLYPRFRVTAANGSSTKEYTVEIRVHQVDPDTLIWTKQILQLPSTVAQQKTLLKDAMFYTFSIDKDNGLYLHKAAKSSSSYESKVALSGLTSSNIVLGSITLFNDQFFALDKANNGYSSADGITWSAKSSNVYAVLGALPDYTTKEDSLLLITKKDDGYYFTKTVDLENLIDIRILNSVETNNIPMSGFSSVTNFDSSNLNSNILAITGGEKLDGTFTSRTWSFQVDDSNVLRLAYNQENDIFTTSLPSFLYDGYLYALTGDNLYKSISFGYKWAAVSTKEMLDPDMPDAHSRSVIVDSDNYIWVFGGISNSGAAPVLQVWKGRLNRLSPKK